MGAIRKGASMRARFAGVGAAALCFAAMGFATGAYASPPAGELNGTYADLPDQAAAAQAQVDAAQAVVDSAQADVTAAQAAHDQLFVPAVDTAYTTYTDAQTALTTAQSAQADADAAVATSNTNLTAATATVATNQAALDAANAALTAAQAGGVQADIDAATAARDAAQATFNDSVTAKTAAAANVDTAVANQTAAAATVASSTSAATDATTGLTAVLPTGVTIGDLSTAQANLGSANAALTTSQGGLATTQQAQAIVTDTTNLLTTVAANGRPSSGAAKALLGIPGTANYEVEVVRSLSANEDAIAAEATTRADADTALGGRIDQEAATRAAADTALNKRIDDESAARIAGDQALGHRIDVLRKDMQGATAVAVAMGGGAFLPNKRLNLTANVAGYEGEGAFAAQLGYLVTPSVALNVGVAKSFSAGGTAGRAGVTFGW